MAKDQKNDLSKELVELKKAVPLLQKAALGDFRGRLKVSEEENKFTELFVSINLMLDDLQEMEKENAENAKYLEELNASLEELVQKKIKVSEETSLRYKLLLDNMPSGVAVYEVKNNGKDFIFKDYNLAGQKIDNMIGQNVIGKNVKDVFPGVEDFGLIKVMKKVWKTGRPEVMPMSNYEDKKLTSWRDNYIYKLPTGEIVAIYSDLTEYKKKEIELQESEDRLRSIYEYSRDAILTLNPKTAKITSANLAALEMYGFNSIEELKTKTPINLSPQKQPDGMLSSKKAKEMIFQAMDKGEAFFEWVHKKKNSEFFWASILLSRVKLQKETIIHAVIRDISERKETERKLQESEKRFKDISIVSSDWIWEVDKEGRYIYIAGKFEELLGYSPEEFIGKTPFDLIPAEDVKKVQKEFLSIIKNKQDIINLENWNVGKDGTKKLFSTSGITLFDKKGNVMGYRGVDRDITEERAAELSLKEKISELEKLNDFMVERELKMIELKKQIQEKSK